MRLVALTVFLISITSPSLAEYLTLECEIKQHIILREHEPVDGIMGSLSCMKGKQISYLVKVVTSMDGPLMLNFQHQII